MLTPTCSFPPANQDERTICWSVMVPFPLEYSWVQLMSFPCTLSAIQYAHTDIISDEKNRIFSQWHAVNSNKTGSCLSNSTHSSTDQAPDFWKDATKVEVAKTLRTLINVIKSNKTGRKYNWILIIRCIFEANAAYDNYATRLEYFYFIDIVTHTPFAGEWGILLTCQDEQNFDKVWQVL